MLLFFSRVVVVVVSFLFHSSKMFVKVRNFMLRSSFPVRHRLRQADAVVSVSERTGFYPNCVINRGTPENTHWHPYKHSHRCSVRIQENIVLWFYLFSSKRKETCLSAWTHTSYTPDTLIPSLNQFMWKINHNICKHFFFYQTLMICSHTLWYLWFQNSSWTFLDFSGGCWRWILIFSHGRVMQTLL